METDYAYDVLNNLTSVTQWGGSSGSSGARTRSFAYDGLSRLLQDYNPESGWTCYGTTGGATPNGSNCATGYDGNGNLLAKTDARGITITYSFDALNRMTWKRYSDGETPIGFGYDGKDENGNPLSGLSNPILTMSHVSNEVNAASTFSYDPMGRVVKKSSCIPGDCSYDINVQATYDLIGNTSSLTNGISNPAITINYSYDGSNRLNSVTSSWNDGTHPPTLFSTPVYGPMGLLSANVGADSSNTPTVTISRAYDNRGRLTSEGDATGKVPTSSATGSSGAITVSGNEKSITRASGTAVATLGVSGSEQSKTIYTCPMQYGGCPTTIYDGGGYSIYVNGVLAGSFGWSQGATSNNLVANLASSINGNSSSPVTAAAAGSSVVLTSKVAGSTGNYSISVTRSWSSSYFSSPSFTVAAPSSMSGGTDATVYDHGTVSVTINNTTASAGWNSGTISGSLAAALASALASADVSFLTVSSSGNTISLNSTGTGLATNWPIQFSVTYDSADFSSPSFSLSASGMSGGQGAAYQNQSIYSFSIPTGGFDGAGNIKTVTDSVTGSWNYTYDTLNRLLTATPTSGPYAGQHGCWAYDAFGNRTAENWQSAACATPETNVPATASYNTNNLVTWTSVNAAVNGFQYDAAGNVLNDNANAYLYDAEGRLCAVMNLIVGTKTGYVYDGLGNRVAKGSLSHWSCNLGDLTVTSRYVVGITGEQLSEVSGSGSWAGTKVFAAGRLLATYHDTNTYFTLNDWLGTKRGEVTPDGFLSTHFGLPFGNGLSFAGNAPDASKNHFIGKERDSETGFTNGNDYFGARYYASSIGRFLSPDPSQLYFANPANTQSFNLYSYALNNPLINTDQAGLYCYYGDTDFSSLQGQADQNDSTQWDYHSTSGECGERGGQWYDDAYTHDRMDDGDRPEYAVSTETYQDINGVPSYAEALNDLVGSSAAGALADIPYGTMFALLPKSINGRKLSFENDPYRLFSTNYCGQGGGGSTSGIINSLCAVHDACFTQAKLDASVNIGTSGSSLTSTQLAAAKSCNQALYEGARRHPYAPGSAALQWWLTQGDKTKPFIGFYILYPGTAAKP